VQKAGKVVLRIDEFARLVHPRDGHPKIFAMIDAYLDESGIHDGAAICAVAGYFGGRSQFRKLEIAWGKILSKYGIPLEEFHATDMVRTRKHQPMLHDLVQVIAAHKVYPVSLGIVVEDFNSYTEKQRRFLTGATLDDKTGKFKSMGCPSKPYFVPFQLCLKTVTSYAPIGGKAHFIFGVDRPFSKYALEMFAQVKKQVSEDLCPWTTWKEKDRLGDPSFPPAKETPQLQAADLYCFLTYKHMMERYAAKDWTVQPSGLLLNCLRNMRSRDDHAFQDKCCLDKMLTETRAILGRKWDD
jgi:hypothetical protein